MAYIIQQFRASWVKENSFPAVKRTVASKTDVASLARQLLTDTPVESIIIFALDSGAKVTGFYHITMDATNTCCVAPATVFRFLLNSGAVSFIMAHNHPGGTLRASEADWKIVKKLKDGADALDLCFFDSIIITGETIISMREDSRWKK